MFKGDFMSFVNYIPVCFLVISLSGCGCYDSYQAAWDACNDKYNGKCSYLGEDFKVCEASSSRIVPCEGDADCASKNPNIEPY